LKKKYSNWKNKNQNWKKNNFFIWLKGEIQKKIQFSKRTQKNQKNEDQNQHKIKPMFWLKGGLKRIIAFTKGPIRKLEIKIIRIKLKNIIPSIWIEWWNWKLIKLSQKC
jgi:hypothetical protein